MAHFAELDEDKKVIKTLVFSNEDIDAHGGDLSTGADEREAATPNTTAAESPTGKAGVSWKQTSNSHAFRKRFAAVGGYFIDDSGEGYFTGFKIHANWVWNTTDGAYYPPVPLPTVLDYAEGGETYEYRIKWDQANTRYTATKIDGDENPYWRIKTTGINATRSNMSEVHAYENVSDPSSDLTQVRVWDATNKSWS